MGGKEQMLWGMTRRDFLKLAGAGLMGTSLLGVAGCGGSEQGGGQGGGQVTLKFANWVSAEEATRKTMGEAISAFEKANPNVKVENVAIPFNEMRQQLLTLSAGGNPPDVMQLSGPWSQELGAQGALVDLKGMLGEEWLNDNYEGALEAGTYQGKLYASPFSLTAHGFWYNKDLMGKAGLDPEQPPKTMQELGEHMRRIKQKLGGQGVYPIGIDTTKIDYALVQFWPWFFAFDARPLYDGVMFDTPQVRAALGWLRDTVDKGYTPVGQDIKVEREIMAKDKIVYKLDGPYMVGILRSLNPALEGDAFYDKFGVTSVPVGENSKSETLADIHQLGISSQAQNQEEALKFLKFLVSSKESINQYQIPLGVIPALKSDQKGDKFEDPVSQAYIKSILPTMVGGPYGPEYGQAQQFIIGAMQRAALENQPIEQITQETQQNLNTVYGQ
jgi:multiple sugar transport system substrate-binding protein